MRRLRASSQAKALLIAVPLFLLILLFTAAPLPAQDLAEYSPREPRYIPELTGANLHYAGLTFHPFVEFSFESDDNIYLTEEDEERDLILSLRAGALVNDEEGEPEFQAGYEAEALWYFDHPAEDRLDHHLFGTLDWGLAGGWHIKLNEEFTRTGTVLEEFDIEKRWRNLAGGGVGYELNHLRFDVDYLNVIDRYDDLETFDRMDHIVTLTSSYRILPKTRLLLEIGRGWVDYDGSSISDADYYQVRVGVSGQLSSKIAGVAKAGYQSRDYDLERPKDFSGFVSYMSLTAKLTERTEVVVKGQRDLVPSTFFDNAYYKHTLLSAEVNQKFASKWGASLAASYERNDYPESVELEVGSLTIPTIFGPITVPLTEQARRSDEVLAATAEVKYHVRDWASIALSYTYRTRSSNLSGFDYDDNCLALTLSMTF